MRKSTILLVLVLLVSGVWAQGPGQRARVQAASARLPGSAIAALQKIDPERIRAHVRFLADDLLEGRGTGQRGGDIAAEYIATQFAPITALTCKRSRWSASHRNPKLSSPWCGGTVR